MITFQHFLGTPLGHVGEWITFIVAGAFIAKQAAQSKKRKNKESHDQDPS